MLFQNDFHARMFTFGWQDPIGGRLRFQERVYLQINGGKPGLDDLESPAPKMNASGLVGATTVTMNTTLDTSFANVDLKYYIYLMGQTLAKSDLHMTIATALVQAAPIAAAEPIHAFDVDSAAFNSILRIADPKNPPRSTPRFLSQRNMFKALVQIPALMLVEDKRWGEANVDIRVGNDVVASGTLRRV